MSNYQNNETLKKFIKHINDQALNGQHLVKASDVIRILDVVAHSCYNQGTIEADKEIIELLKKMEVKS